MTVRLPDPQQPTTDDARKAAARDFLADLESIMQPTPGPDRVPSATSFRDDTQLPAIGPTPPVAQPGRPPMSQRATDISGVMVASSVPTIALGGAATGILWVSGHVDPAVVAMVCAAPTTLVLALSRLMKRTKETVEAAPAEQHHHYSGPVYQDHRNVNTQTRGVWATTRNELPR